MGKRRKVRERELGGWWLMEEIKRVWGMVIRQTHKKSGT